MATERDYILSFRFGFGLGPRGPVDPLAEIITAPAPASAPPPITPARLSGVMAQYDKLYAAPENAGKQKSLNLVLAALYHSDVHAAITAATTSQRAFTQRLAAFWCNHFSLGDGKWPRVLAGTYAAEAIAPHLFGNFADLLIAVETHPAMMLYLNLNESVGPNSVLGRRRLRGLNENLGREVLELHALGADGGYGQADVVAMARLMTGWHVNLKAGQTAFSRFRAEPGPKRLLDKDFGGPKPDRKDYLAALRHVARNDACGHFIARKLTRHFFGSGADAVAAEIEAVFKESKGDLAAVYAAMVTTKAAISPLGGLARNDFEFLVGALRAGSLKDGALGPLTAADGAVKPHPLTVAAMAALTQKLWLAPSPKGWPDDPEFWLSPTTIAARLRRIPLLVRQFTDEDPARFARDTLGPLARPETLSAVRLASNRQLGLGLVLASPEFNRR